jgi:hypothetical protein
MSAVNQIEPESNTPQNDITLGGNLLSLAHVKDARARQLHRILGDHMDENREKFYQQIEFVERDKDTGYHRIFASPFDPSLVGTNLVPVDSFMYQLSPIATIRSYDPNLNERINLVTDEVNTQVWTVSLEGAIKIAINLQNPNENVHGIGITFDNIRITNYKMTISFINEDNKIKSEIINVLTSARTNTKQFFLLNNIVDNINRITIQLEENTTDTPCRYEIKNISVFNYVNKNLLRSMAKNNIIYVDEIDNPIFLKEHIDDI